MNRSISTRIQVAVAAVLLVAFAGARALYAQAGGGSPAGERLLQQQRLIDDKLDRERKELSERKTKAVQGFEEEAAGIRNRREAAVGRVQGARTAEKRLRQLRGDHPELFTN